jgi:thioredoxin reductase
LVPQAALAAALYGARKGSEAITTKRAEKLVEMLAKRSPEYERRVKNLPPMDRAPAGAALIRALLGQQ